MDLVRAPGILARQGWRALISLICSLRPSYNIQIRRSAPLFTARQATTRPNHNFVAVNTTRHATSQVVIHNHYKHDIHNICSSKHNRARYNTKKPLLVEDKAYQSCIFRKPASRNILPPPAQAEEEGFDWPNIVRPRWRWHSSPPPPPCSALAKQRCQSVEGSGQLTIIEVWGDVNTAAKITSNKKKSTK